MAEKLTAGENLRKVKKALARIESLPQTSEERSPIDGDESWMKAARRLAERYPERWGSPLQKVEMLRKRVLRFRDRLARPEVNCRGKMGR